MWFPNTLIEPVQRHIHLQFKGFSVLYLADPIQHASHFSGLIFKEENSSKTRNISNKPCND